MDAVGDHRPFGADNDAAGTETLAAPGSRRLVLHLAEPRAIGLRCYRRAGAALSFAHKLLVPVLVDAVRLRLVPITGGSE
jgi:hypothetical protein